MTVKSIDDDLREERGDVKEVGETEGAGEMGVKHPSSYTLLGIHIRTSLRCCSKQFVDYRNTGYDTTKTPAPSAIATSRHVAVTHGFVSPVVLTARAVEIAQFSWSMACQKGSMHAFVCFFQFSCISSCSS